MAMTPRIVKSPLTGHWFVLTRYRERDGIDLDSGEKTRYLVAQTKYDGSDDRNSQSDDAQKEKQPMTTAVDRASAKPVRLDTYDNTQVGAKLKVCRGCRRKFYFTRHGRVRCMWCRKGK